MKKLLVMMGLLLAMGVPALAQSQQMSPDDQGRFNSYYSRWLEYKQTNDRDDMIGMEQRMLDLMNKYRIPSNTPYDMVASQSGYPGPNTNYDRDRGYSGSW